jgi:hypothetical protein
MAEYIVTQTRVLVVEANSAAEARSKAESVFYVRPGFDRNLRREIRETSFLVEKRRR